MKGELVRRGRGVVIRISRQILDCGFEHGDKFDVKVVGEGQILLRRVRPSKNKRLIRGVEHLSLSLQPGVDYVEALNNVSDALSKYGENSIRTLREMRPLIEAGLSKDEIIHLAKMGEEGVRMLIRRIGKRPLEVER